MNLKESFRLMNHLGNLKNNALNEIRDGKLMFDTTIEHKCSIVDPSREDWVEKVKHEGKYSIDELAEFLKYIMEARVDLSAAIYAAKREYGEDLDSAVSLNIDRQNIYRDLSYILRGQPAENKKGQAYGYKFNEEGNQTMYKYDTVTTETEAYDRVGLKAFARELIEEADRVSSEIDEARVRIKVNYQCLISPNDSFYDAIEKVVGRNTGN